MYNKGWELGWNKSGEKTIQPNLGNKSQKELFTILTFAVWYKVFRMNI